MSVVIQVENLSKYYRLGLIGGGTLREDINRWWAMTRGRPDPLLRIGQEDHGNRVGGELWALRDVSFEVREGEILGIIGRNGAGKSTLLKILSRITAPTSGQIKIRGRVGSLLEVGTGFHPELTGRENIYLNGAILGMKKPEITRKLDEIIDFAEIEQFIDTPVKRYSSGMTVRLAFAVAAYLEPEILIIDEVLAVGDAAFQKKCLGKMKDVAGHGRTVLFVSHNMGSISDLCTRATLIEHGKMKTEGHPKDIVERYLTSGTHNASSRQWQNDEAPGDTSCRLLSIEVFQSNQPISTSAALITLPVDIRTTVRIDSAAEEIGINTIIVNSEGKIVVHSSSIMNRALRKMGVGEHKLSALLPSHLLNAGFYSVSASAAIPYKRLIFNEPHAVSFSIAADCTAMGRYSENAWTGITGPGIAAWTDVDP
ncbi:ABC transporter ATP-binding protein [Thiocapsa roseopersicina]|uniref:Lipopolysaccharide transport system ATP-binding protein n=1 Tax=Thiocapsa roseopersicina TaxID=1058 RepID=A0A1H2QAA8_THIRO|nr:ABC transporter ATP-binding protein [Thiocapsa roseopersicina]SDW04091.1 lipopolysaccharide transport system ATP-binding protein [Thiocapsa roseopersicina]